MKRILHILFIISFICVSTSIHGMKRKNSTTLTIRNSNYICHQVQEAPVLFPELIAHIAGYCWPKEKNLLMRVSEYFCACLQSRKLIVRANLRTVGITDKKEALIEYAHEGDVNMTEFLLKNGVKANCWNILGITPFHDAHPNVMPLLIEHGALVNEPKPLIYPLHAAVYKNDTETVKTLLALKADPNLALAISATPLHIAAQEGYTEIVKLLLDNGANVNQVNNQGTTSLLMASKNGHTKTVKGIAYCSWYRGK